MTLTVGSLFSGIGGMDLGFVAAGFDILFQVEINEFCRKVLRKHDNYWPNAAQYVDVRRVARRSGKGWRRYQQLPCVDVLCGGFPCQPHSVAGARLGEADSRNLWPEFRRLIGDIRPRAILLENVPGITTTIGTSVIADLAALGYVGRAGIISAQDTGAPHVRERWWCVAYADRQYADDGGYVAVQLSQQQKTQLPGNEKVGVRSTRRIKPRMGRDVDGLSAQLDSHRWPAPQGTYQHPHEPPRTVSGKMPYRAARIEALGNAVVPHIVYALAVEMKNVLEQIE